MQAQQIVKLGGEAHPAGEGLHRILIELLPAVGGYAPLAQYPPPQRALQPGESPFQFSARPQELIWVGVMPARFGMGGRSYFRLALEAGQGGQALVLRFAPWDGAARPPDWNAAQSYVIAPVVTSFAMFYEDAWQPVPQWVGAWQRVDSLPARVRIELATGTGPWPLWIVPMRALPANQPGAARFTMGGE